jgi:SAM-dependent methyltransferase
LIGEHELRQIRPLVPDGSVVLDYGCGTGRTTLDMLRRGFAVTAYDISGEMLSLAREKALQENRYAEFILDLDDLSGRTWPVVTCIGVLDYYPDPVPLTAFVTMPGGRLAHLPECPSPLLAVRWAPAHIPVTPNQPEIGDTGRRPAPGNCSMLSAGAPTHAGPVCGSDKRATR